MILFDPSPVNPSRDVADTFIATGTAALIAGLAAAGATTATSLYSANKQSGAAQDAAKLQTDAANKSAELQSKSAADALAFQKQQAAQDLQTTNATQQANYNQWAARESRLSNFQQALGMAPRNIPAYQPLPNGQSAPTSGPMPSGQAPSGGGNATALKALLDQGMDPQQAVAQFNKQFGRSTGNEAVYYDPSQHGGVATIGLPDAYLAKPGNSWDITVRGAAATPSAAPKNSMAAALSSPSQASPYSAMMTPALQMPTPVNSFAQFLGR